MTFILRGLRPAAVVMRMDMSTCRLRGFSSGASRAMKEIDRDHPDAGNKYEQHKQDQLKKQKEGKAEWKAELASSSEEAVVADKHEHADHSEEGLKDLQRKTKGVAEEKQK